MDIQLNVKEFRSSLAVAASAISARSAHAALLNVLATVTDEGMTLYATDNEASIMLSVEVVGGVKGSTVLLPPKRLLAILNEMTAETVMLTITDNSIRVRAVGADFRLSNEAATDFPLMSRASFEDCFKIQSVVLRRMIHRTSYAADVESTRYALGGVMFNFDGQTLDCVATDSRRLAMCSAAVERIGDTVNIQGVVPSRALKLLDKLPDGDVEIVMTDKSIFFRSEGFECSSRLVEGRFPNYRAVIPKKDGAIEIVVLAGLAVSAVRQAMVVTTEESRGVDFCLRENQMVIKSQASDVGSSEIELPVQTSGDDEINVTLDPKYMGDFLKTIPYEDTVYWRMRSPDEAVVLTDGDDYLYVMMPLSQDR